MKNTNQTKKENKTMNKRKIFVAAVAISLVAILSLGTLAWFTDSDEMTNNFFVGNTQVDPDEVFGIDLWETSDTNGDGQISDDETKGKETKDDEGFTYEEILPGQLIDKDPYFTNTGIHPQYVRAIVTVTEADILYEAMTPKDSDVSEWFDVPKFLPGTGDKWSLEYKYYTNKDTFVFVYYYTEALGAGLSTQKLFDDVAIPTELTKEQAAEIENFKITIVGQAIQSEHLADVTTAKEAFAKYWDEEGYVAGVNTENDINNGPTAITYPVSGDLGTVKTGESLIEYDPANYNDPVSQGALWFSGATADIKAGASLITIPANGEMNPTIVLHDVELTIEDGGYILSTENGSSGQVIFYGGITINGVKYTNYDQLDALKAKYFNNYNGSITF